MTWISKLARTADPIWFELTCFRAGDSGMGAYHGRHGFDTFTHRRVVTHLPDWLDRFMSFRYPPYNLEKSSPMTTFPIPPFKRGETIADQRIVNSGSIGLQILGTAITVAGVAIVLARTKGVILTDLVQKIGQR